MRRLSCLSCTCDTCFETHKHGQCFSNRHDGIRWIAEHCNDFLIWKWCGHECTIVSFLCVFVCVSCTHKPDFRCLLPDFRCLMSDGSFSWHAGSLIPTWSVPRRICICECVSRCLCIALLHATLYTMYCSRACYMQQCIALLHVTAIQCIALLHVTCNSVLLSLLHATMYCCLAFNNVLLSCILHAMQEWNTSQEAWCTRTCNARGMMHLCVCVLICMCMCVCVCVRVCVFVCVYVRAGVDLD